MHAADRELLAAFTVGLPAELGRDAPVVVAVSGGSDSMALLHLLRLWRDSQFASDRAAPPHMIAFHFDHAWHANSRELASWVQHELAGYGVPTVVRRRSAPTAASRSGGEPSRPRAEVRAEETSPIVRSTEPPPESFGPQAEAAARNLRYAALAEVVAETSADWVLTGHTRDDQVETVLMRIARGTGLAGLAGIPARRSLGPGCQLLRPLLSFGRGQLRDFLDRQGFAYREDPTNTDPRWTRNRVRSQVLPWLRDHLNPRMDDSLLGLASLANDFQTVVGSLAMAYQAAIVSEAGVALAIDLRALAGLPEPAVRALLRHWWNQAQLPEQEMSQAHWRRLSALAVRPSTDATRNWPSQLHLPGPWMAKRSQGRLRIQRPAE